MKNIFKSIMCIAAAAMAFTACSTADINEEITAPQTITVKFNALAENMTRTSFGDYDSTNKEYPTLWQGGETIKLALGLTTGNDSSPVVASADNTSASFEAEFETTDEAPYTLYAICPSSAWVSGINASYKSWNIEIPTTQEPTATSCDPKAQILYGKAENLASLTEDVNISFKHLVAYAKFSFSNLNLDGATIQNITIEGDKNIAHRYYFYVETNTISESNALKLITINTTSYEDIWVALAPVADLSTLTFTINTDKGPLKKTVNLPADKAFEAGKVAGFTVNMSGVEFEESVKYELLTDVANLAIGDNVIIAAANADYAIGAQANNNRTATAVTKDENYIVDPNSSVEIFTVGEGIVENTYSLQNEDGTYIFAASSTSNHLKSEETLSENSSWAITVTNTGVATIISQGEYTRNTIRYNNGNNNNLFSCYASGQNDVAIYYKSNGGVVPPKTPVINAENPEAVAAEDTTITILYTVSYPVDDKVLTVTESVDWVTAVAVGDANVTLTITANESEEAREATITLSYEGAADKVVTISQEGVYVAPEPGTGTEKTATFTFGNMSLTNAVAYTEFTVEDIVVTFDLGSNTGGLVPKYYNTGKGMRLYVGNTMVFSKAATSTATSITITNIKITAASASYLLLNLTSGQPGTTSTDGAVMSWTGESASVSFTGNGTGRYPEVVVTYIAE